MASQRSPEAWWLGRLGGMYLHGLVVVARHLSRFGSHFDGQPHSDMEGVPCRDETRLEFFLDDGCDAHGCRFLLEGIIAQNLSSPLR